MLDTNFAGNRVSDPSYAALVIADLEVAIKDSLIDELANADHVVVAWLNVNGLKIENGVIFGPR
jgi:hypothetical protein